MGRGGERCGRGEGGRGGMGRVGREEGEKINKAMSLEQAPLRLGWNECYLARSEAALVFVLPYLLNGPHHLLRQRAAVADAGHAAIAHQVEPAGGGGGGSY